MANIRESTVVLDVGSKETTFFVPDLDEDFPVWHGVPPSPASIKETYNFTRVYLKCSVSLTFEKALPISVARIHDRVMPFEPQELAPIVQIQPLV